MHSFLRATLVGVLLLLAAGLAIWHWPASKGGYTDFLLEPAGQSSTPGLRLAWGGVSSLLLSDGHTTLAIDPFYSRPLGVLKLALNQSMQPDPAAIEAGLQAAGMPKVDAVLVSHAHYDHSMDAGVLARDHAALLMGGPSVMQIGRGAGVPAAQRVAVQAGQSYTVGQFRVRFVPSTHAGATGGYPTGTIEQPLKPPQGYAAYKLGQVWSILIEHPMGTLLHHGSAGFIPGQLAAAHVDVDLLLLGVALVDDWPAYLEQVLDASQAHTVIPVHWDNFLEAFQPDVRPMPLVVDLPEFFAVMRRQRPQIRIATLPAGAAVAAPVEQP
jgi:L-ascorbate metabolism protein UlaG (beta-lactamase superfamily)